MSKMGDKNTQRSGDTFPIQDDPRLSATSVQPPEEAAGSRQQIQASDGSDYSSPSGITIQPTSSRMPSEGAKKKKSVTFPVDELIVTDYYEPVVYFNQNDDAPDQDIVDLYKAMCEKLNVSPSEVLIPQMRDADPEEPTLNICELLEAPSMEALEPAFRKAQFTKLIISAEQSEEGMRALIEILEFFQTVRVIQMTIDSGVSEPVWDVFCTHLRKARNVEELDLGGTPVTDPELMFFGKVLRRVSSLTVLRMPRCGLTGINLGILSEGLRWNATVTHVYFNDNDMDVNDCKALAHLLRVNFNIEYMDLSNNDLRDDGVGFLCDAISEQSEEEGIKVLILTNTGLTCEVGTCFNKVLNSCCILETLVLSSNDIGTEGIVRMKEGALRSRTLRQLELRGTNIDCEGVAHLAQIIYFNPDLERLDLRDNPIKYPGLAALRDCLVLGAGPIEIELDDREKELQPMVEEIRKKSLGIGEDSYRCPPEERGEDFEEKVKLLLDKTLRRRREGGAYGMQHLAELVEQLKKELQEKKSGGSLQKTDDQKPDEHQKGEPKESPKNNHGDSSDKCKPDQKPDKKDDDEGGDGPQTKGPTQRMTGTGHAASGHTQDRPKSDDKSDKNKRHDDGGSDGPETRGPVKEKTENTPSDPRHTHGDDESDDRSDTYTELDDGASHGPRAKGPVGEKSGKDDGGSGEPQDKCKPDDKSDGDKKDDDDRPDGHQGRGPVRQMTEGSTTTQGQRRGTSKEEPLQKQGSRSQQGENRPGDDGQRQQGTPMNWANVNPKPKAEVTHTLSERLTGSQTESPATKTPEGQKPQGILKREVPPPVPDRSKKPVIKTQTETTTTQGKEKRIDCATQVEWTEIIRAQQAPRSDILSESAKRGNKPKRESYFCELTFPLRIEVANNRTIVRSADDYSSEVETVERTDKVSEHRDDSKPEIAGGARGTERTEVPTNVGVKKERMKSPNGSEGATPANVEWVNDFEERDEEELIDLTTQASDSDDDYVCARTFADPNMITPDSSPDKPRRKFRSPEPSPRSSPLPPALKKRLKKSRGACAAKDAMHEAIAQGMPRCNAVILAEGMRRATERVVEEEEESESLFMTRPPREQAEESDDEDLLGAVGRAPKLPPRAPRPPPLMPKKEQKLKQVVNPTPQSVEQPKPTGSQESKPTGDEPPAIAYPSKFAKLGVRIPSCMRYNVHSWESALNGTPPSAHGRGPQNQVTVVPNRPQEPREGKWSQKFAKCGQDYPAGEDIYQKVITNPVESVYGPVLVPVTPMPTVNDDPNASQNRSRVLLRRSQNGELITVEPRAVNTTGGLGHESGVVRPASEPRKNRTKRKSVSKSSRTPYSKDHKKDSVTEADPPNSAAKSLKNALSKIKDNLKMFKRSNEKEDFWDLEYDKRFDLIEREQIRESIETAVTDQSSGTPTPIYTQSQTQTDFKEHRRKEPSGKGSIWSTKSSQMKGKSKKKRKPSRTEALRNAGYKTDYCDDGENDDWPYYIPTREDLMKMNIVGRRFQDPRFLDPWFQDPRFEGEWFYKPKPQEQTSQGPNVSEPNCPANNISDPNQPGPSFIEPSCPPHSYQDLRYPGPSFIEPSAPAHSYTELSLPGPSYSNYQRPSSQARQSSEKGKYIEFEPDEKGNKVPLELDASKWLEYEPDEKGKKVRLYPDMPKWHEYEPGDKGKKVEFEDGTSMNWYDWEEEQNRPSTSRSAGASGSRTALGSRLQATISHMSNSAARNI